MWCRLITDSDVISIRRVTGDLLSHALACAYAWRCSMILFRVIKFSASKLFMRWVFEQKTQFSEYFHGEFRIFGTCLARKLPRTPTLFFPPHPYLVHKLFEIRRVFSIFLIFLNVYMNMRDGPSIMAGNIVLGFTTFQKPSSRPCSVHVPAASWRGCTGLRLRDADVGACH